MTDFKQGDRVMRRRISRETNPLAVGEVVASDGQHVAVIWRYWDGRNQRWYKHKIRSLTRVIIPFDGNEYQRRYEIVHENVDDWENPDFHGAWNTPDAHAD